MGLRVRRGDLPGAVMTRTEGLTLPDRERLARLLAESIAAHEASHQPWRGQSCLAVAVPDIGFGSTALAGYTDLLAVADDVLAAMKET